jgi:hypothetical protein
MQQGQSHSSSLRAGAPALRQNIDEAGIIVISNKKPEVRRVKTASFKNLNVYLLAFLC